MLGVGAIERASRVAQVDVVERRPREGHRGRLHAVGVEGGEHGGDRRRAVAGARVQRPAVERGVADAADARERQPGGGVVGIDELDLDPVALEL